MYRFCTEYGIPHERCGKVVVARNDAELPALDELERRGRENGLKSIRRLDYNELREQEPHVAAVAGLHVEETGIVNYQLVAEQLGRLICEQSGEIKTSLEVIEVRQETTLLSIITTNETITARNLVNCAGLQSDRIARMCGVDPEVRIVPFRGEYYKLLPSRENLVRNLIYPVPDSRFPFLGAHFTRMIGGGVEAGPNAVLAFKREGYSRASFSLRDTLATVSYAGFWKMAARYFRTGIGEFHRSFSKRAFVRALQRLVPELRPEDLERHGAGVRAQAVDRSGALMDDFKILETGRMVHVLNAPSPAATASLSIGDAIAARAEHVFSR
jgi:L-2-hydroxyglutarate oxidase